MDLPPQLMRMIASGFGGFTGAFVIGTAVGAIIGAIVGSATGGDNRGGIGESVGRTVSGGSDEGRATGIVGDDTVIGALVGVDVG